MTTEPIRSRKQVRELAHYWLKRGNHRNYALIVLGVCTAEITRRYLGIQQDDRDKVYMSLELF